MKFIFVLLAFVAISQASHLKDDLLSRLNTKAVDLHRAIEKYNHIGLFYFSQQLNETLIRIDELEDGIRQLPEDAGETVADYWIQGTKEIELRVPNQILSPAPDEIVKIKTLYVAVARYLDHDMITMPAPMTMKNYIVRIVHGEIFYKTLNQSEKVVVEKTEAVMRLIYRDALNALKNIRVITHDEIDQLIADVREKIKILIADNKKIEAKMWEDEAKNLENLTFILSAVLPIDSIYKLESWWNGAEQHYRSLSKLKMFVFNFNEKHVCKKEPCN